MMIEPVEPEMSQGEGNTIPSPSMTKVTQNQAIKWCFTLNNYTEIEFNAVCSICSKFCDFVVIGKEIGASGTPHLQGYLEFKKKSRPMTIFKEYKRIHWEKARGSKDDNIAYCSKENLVFNIGLPKPIKIITEL